jgi:hypothetical protein
MYKPSTYLKVAYFPTYLPIWDLFPTELVTKMKPNINSGMLFVEAFMMWNKLSELGMFEELGMINIIFSKRWRVVMI